MDSRGSGQPAGPRGYIALAGFAALFLFGYLAIRDAGLGGGGDIPVGGPNGTYDSDPAELAHPEPSPERASIALAPPVGRAPVEALETPGQDLTPTKEAPPEAPAGPSPTGSIRLRYESSLKGPAFGLLGRGTGLFKYPTGEPWKRLPMEAISIVESEVLFDELPYGTYSVGLALPDRGERWTYLKIGRDTPSRVINMGDGRASIQGGVWDKAGAPIEGAHILVQCPGKALDPGATERPMTVSFRAMVDTDGRYELDGLTAGAGWARMKLPEDYNANRFADGRGNPRRTVLEEGSTVTEEFGYPEGHQTLAVTLRDAMGDPMWGGSIIAWPKDWPAKKGKVYGNFEDDGRATPEFPPGEWNLYYYGFDGEHTLNHPITVGSAELGPLELQVSERRVIGQALITGDEDRGHGRFDSERHKVTLRERDGHPPRLIAQSRIDAHGRFRFDHLTPGTYDIETRPSVLFADQTLTVTKGDRDLSLTITLQAAPPEPVETLAAPGGKK